jgi:arylformamidase
VVDISDEGKGKCLHEGKRAGRAIMEIFDISVGIHERMHVFPGDPSPDIRRVMSLPVEAANVSVICIGTHTGTHVDPPVHYLEKGYTVDEIPMDHLYGDAEVLDLTGSGQVIGKDDVGNVKAKIVLLKTKNSGLWKSPGFRSDFTYIDEGAASALIAQGVTTVGIDYLSIAAFEHGADVHKALLGAGMTIVEGLDLSAVSAGKYRFACLPLKIVGGDGGPARAILIRE